MTTFISFIIRLMLCALFEWVMFLTTTAQPSLVVTQGARITVSLKAQIVATGTIINNGTIHCFEKIVCSKFHWGTTGQTTLGDSASIVITDPSPYAITNYDSSSRFFILGKDARVTRLISEISEYAFPVGYYLGESGYRGFVLNMKSLGTTGTNDVSVNLIPEVSGEINYEQYFPSNDTTCLSNAWIAFNCLSSDGWHCDGPNDYEYSVHAFNNNFCGGSMRRVIKTSTETNHWQDSLTSVVGNFSSNICNYSDWSGTASYVPGGTYRDFSDFTIASSSSALPVTLVDLKAEPVDEKCIRISWKTELEINNDKFLIGRSLDAKTFTVIGEIGGAGNTTTPQNYYFDDCTADQNISYYYQLEQIDYDGAVHFSEIVSARLSADGVLETRLFNFLGQEIAEPIPNGFIIRQKMKSGLITCRKVKPLP